MREEVLRAVRSAGLRFVTVISRVWNPGRLGPAFVTGHARAVESYSSLVGREQTGLCLKVLRRRSYPERSRSRSSDRRILPLIVFGSSSTKWISRGYL